MVVDFETERAFRPGPPRRLFQVAGVLQEWSLTQDGSRFLFPVPVSPPPPFNIVWNLAVGSSEIGRERRVDGGGYGPDRDRTGDLLNAIQARSQLRYRPLLCG